MHPGAEIFYLCGLSAALVLVALARPLVAEEEDDEFYKVVVASPVIVQKVHVGQRSVGTVNPLRSSTIGSAVDGRVIEFLVEHGDPVEGDQPLARLRTETLEIELAAARAEHDLYQQQLAELENGSRPEDIAEARARMLGAKAAMENAAGKLKRMETLSLSRAASATDLEDARAQAKLMHHLFLAAEALLKRTEQGPRVEQIAQAEAQVELQRQRVRLIEDRIAKHTIVAPFDGFVSARFTEVGAWITGGDAVAEVVQLDEVEILVPATAEYAVHLRPGDTIRVEFPELPDQLFTGRVERVVPVAQSQARTFPVYIRLANPIRDGTPLLMAGMLARVELPTGRHEIAPLVSKDALVLNRGARSVFVVDLPKDSAGAPAGANRRGTVREVPVGLGVAAGGLIQVRGAVQADDLVVVVGNERLHDGDLVEIGRIVETDLSDVEPKLHSASVH